MSVMVNMGTFCLGYCLSNYHDNLSGTLLQWSARFPWESTGSPLEPSFLSVRSGPFPSLLNSNTTSHCKRHGWVLTTLLSPKPWWEKLWEWFRQLHALVYSLHYIACTILYKLPGKHHLFYTTLCTLTCWHYFVWITLYTLPCICYLVYTAYERYVVYSTLYALPCVYYIVHTTLYTPPVCTLPCLYYSVYTTLYILPSIHLLVHTTLYTLVKGMSDHQCQQLSIRKYWDVLRTNLYSRTNV